MRARWILGVSLAVAAWGSAAQTIACHIAYAGATRVFHIPPASHTSEVTPLLEGATLALEVVNRLPPAPGAGVTVRTLSVQGDAPVLIHQATYLPRGRPTGVHGFTGLQVVRDPVRGNELSYWCERLPRRRL
ncbi:MAG: hypothetical protein ACUVVU_01860 [Tepidimonas sp.]|uniref:hypothetical protein n=1 Tax=Tepidimonas sp. TaxID=2002775 RepID=UPI004054C8E4